MTTNLTELFKGIRVWVNLKLALLQSQVTSIESDRIKFYIPVGVAAKTTSPYCCSQWVIADDKQFVPVDGMTIKIRIPIAGNSSYGTCIKVNNEYHPVVYNVNTEVGTRYGVNSTMVLTYNATQTGKAYINSASSQTITGVWQMEDFDSTITFQLLHDEGRYTASADIKRYKVCITDENGITPFSDGSSTSGHNYCLSFKPFGQILFMSSSTTNAYSTGDLVNPSYLYQQKTFDARYTFNGGTTMLTINKDVYLQCEKNSDGTFKLLGLSQTLPSSVDSKYYIYLGHSYSQYLIELHPEHKILYYDSNDGLVEYIGKNIPTKISDLIDDTSTNPIDKADTLTGLTSTIAELNYCDGVTSNIQTQLNGKQATLSAGTNISLSNNTVSFTGSIPGAVSELTDDIGIIRSDGTVKMGATFLTQTIIPDEDLIYDLGSSDKQFNTLFTKAAEISSLTASDLSAALIYEGSTLLSNKYVSKVSGKDLSTNDYTTAEKNKLAGLATVATSGSYNDLSNKPTIPSISGLATTAYVNLQDSILNNTKANKIVIEDDSEVAEDLFSIHPNTFYQFGARAVLEIELIEGESTEYNEYMFEFEAHGSPMSLIVPLSVTWLVQPNILDGYIYHVSIVNNLGIIGGWAV